MLLSYFLMLIRDESGQGLTEYALIIGAIAITVFFVLMVGIRGHVVDIFERVSEEVEDVK